MANGTLWVDQNYPKIVSKPIAVRTALREVIKVTIDDRNQQLLNNYKHNCYL